MATKVRAAHILVSSQLRAQQLIGRIRNGESFEALAKEYSACPSKANGGDLGYFERGQMENHSRMQRSMEKLVRS